MKDFTELAAKLDDGLKTLDERLENKINEYAAKVDSGEAVSSELKAELSALGKEYTASMAKLKELNDTVTVMQQEGVKITEKPVFKSLGAQFIEHESFKNFIDGKQNKCRVDFQNNTIIGEGGSPQNPTNDIVPLQTMPGIVGGAFRNLRIMDILPRGVATGNTIHYTKEELFTNNAAETSESGQKPETVLTFEGADTPVRTIAHFIKVSKQVLDDAPALQSYIDARMSYGVNLRVESQVLNGDGVSPNLSGITTTGNHTDLTVVSGDNDFDAANRAKYQVSSADYMADVYIINPADWGRMERLKVGTGDDRYVGADGAINYINGGLTATLWGLPVVLSNSMAAGTFTCTSLAALMYWEKQQTTVELFDQNEDDVEHNLLTVRGETRGAFTVFRASAVIVGAWPDA